MGYQVVNRSFQRGMFTRAIGRVEDEIQPVLDEGAAQGWRLHTFQVTEDDGLINLIFIWETPDQQYSQTPTMWL